jgi:hypothetical protein
MRIEQLSGIDTAVSNEKYNAYGTVKSKIANAYNRLPLRSQQLKFNERLQDLIDEDINGIGRPRRKSKASKSKARKEKKEKRKARRKDDKGLRALRIFMPLMRRRLKKKGVKIVDPKSIREVSGKFRKFIIDKTPINGYDEVIGIDPVTEGAELSTSIIKKIIEFIKKGIQKIKARKNKGEKLSAEEQEDLKDGETQEKDEKEGGSSLLSSDMAVPLLAAGAAAFFLFK